MPVRSIRDRIRVPFDPFAVSSAPVLDAPSMVRCSPLPEDLWSRQPVTITYNDPPPRRIDTQRQPILTDHQMRSMQIRKRKDTR
jgi:hypothetical protein